MNKTIRFLALALGVVLATGALATAASATPGKTTPCSNCHWGPNVPVTATMSSASGTNATYSVSASGANAIAVFGGTAKVALINGASGQFTVPIGTTYTVFAVKGPGTSSGIGVTHVAPTGLPPSEAMRLWGTDRYTCAVQIARYYSDADSSTAGTQWETNHIVIASGDDRALADPLAAAGLCGVYDAPLFLVNSTSVPAAVRVAVREIAAAASGSVTVHIIGGTASVPDARFSELAAYVGPAGTLVKDRVAGATRYDTAAAVARRIAAVRGSAPEAVLVANGADATKFFDALALSPISAAQRYPLLLVQQGVVPEATARALGEIRSAGGAATVIVGGGPLTVSDAVKTSLGATRWSGGTRYDTAIAIVDAATVRGWVSREHVAVAAKMPDALSGGAGVGLHGGALVLTSGTALSPATGAWLRAHKGEIADCRVFGGANSVSTSVVSAIGASIQ